MGSINYNRKFIDTKLFEEMRLLSPDDRRRRYDTELKGIISSLLKDCYPDNLTEKIDFYKEAFASWISFYDADSLLMNLFFEKDCMYIVNSLCKLNAFDDVSSTNLSQLSSKFIEFIKEKCLVKSSFTNENEKALIQSFLMELISNIENSDWTPERSKSNTIIRKFLKYVNENLNTENLENGIMAFLLFIKLWDCFDEYSNPFNNDKACVFYNIINAEIKTKLDNSSADLYVHLSNEIINTTSSLFVELKYIPLIDNSDNNYYNSGYLAQRMRNQDLMNQAREIEKISSSWNYIDLIKEVSEDCPNYQFQRYLNSIIEKIKKYNYPTDDEIKIINEIQSNKNIDLLKMTLFEKLYIFENIVN
jgi:hypothetical protein